MSDGLQYLGKGSLFGIRGIVVRLQGWEGPERPGDKGRRVWSEPLFFPKDQARFGEHHLRHPQGYGQHRTACVSPSCSYYKKLLDRGRFRWQDRSPESVAARLAKRMAAQPKNPTKRVM